MDQKIQELTDRIYQEGFEKGEEKAREIIRDAETRAARIVDDAKSEAASIITAAQKQAEELKRNTETEVRLSTEQAISAVKLQILNVLEGRIIGENLTKTLSDPLTVKELVSTMIANWKTSSDSFPALEVLLPAQKEQELLKAFQKAASDLLNEGAEVKFSTKFKAGFRIGPLNGTFKISLTDEDFKEFFKEYLRPRTRKLLFGE